MSAKDFMAIDMRKHDGIRAQVKDGLQALRLQGRQIWGDDYILPGLADIVVRLMVGAGDLARLARDGHLRFPTDTAEHEGLQYELKKELGNLIFSTVRWIDDLGLDVLECLDLAIEAQEKFAKSGRPR